MILPRQDFLSDDMIVFEGHDPHRGPGLEHVSQLSTSVQAVKYKSFTILVLLCICMYIHIQTEIFIFNVILLVMNI